MTWPPWTRPQRREVAAAPRRVAESFVLHDGRTTAHTSDCWPIRSTRPNPNTVQLERADCGVRWVFGLGPVGVGGAFDVPFGHLAFDDAGC